jgi:hypothetical protein
MNKYKLIVNGFQFDGLYGAKWSSEPTLKN